MTATMAAARSRNAENARPAAKPRRLVFHDDTFVFDRVSGLFYRLNPSAAFALRAIESGHAREELPALLEKEFGIEHGTAVRDAELFLNELSMLDILSDEPT